MNEAATTAPYRIGSAIRHAGRIGLLLAGLALLAFLCRRLGLAVLGNAITRADAPRFALFVALSTAVFVVYAKRWSIVLEAMGAGKPRLSLATLVGFRAAEHAVSTLLPSAHLSGEPMRALLLRRRRRDWPRAIAAVATDRLLDASGSAVAGPLYVTVFLFAHESSAWAAPWALGGMIAAGLALVTFYVQAYRGGTLISFLARRGFFPSIRGSLETIDRSLGEFVHTRTFFLALALSFLAEALIIAELWTLASAFALPISLATLVGVMVGMGVAQIIPIPAALGSLEATEVGVLLLAGASAPLGLAVGLLIRLRETLWILCGLAVLYREGLSLRGLAFATTSGNAAAIESKG